MLFVCRTSRRAWREHGNHSELAKEVPLDYARKLFLFRIAENSRRYYLSTRVVDLWWASLCLSSNNRPAMTMLLRRTAPPAPSNSEESESPGAVQGHNYRQF
ncbi:hypothetical protein VP01_1221g3 [Puccinia sorghi]|uniref:Uncharacterized protein n=1 Tax=Puccinia sorghi TaxID=27349 RepID=A0A0L6VQ21_9BASI|nr:hypothetical protein VP01_1221g3 [Puccinia sorghi]